MHVRASDSEEDEKDCRAELKGKGESHMRCAHMYSLGHVTFDRAYIQYREGQCAQQELAAAAANDEHDAI